MSSAKAAGRREPRSLWRGLSSGSVLLFAFAFAVMADPGVVGGLHDRGSAAGARRNPIPPGGPPVDAR